jgi:hypothetical protein
LPLLAIECYLLLAFYALLKINAGGADIDFYVGAPKQYKPDAGGADMEGNVCATRVVTTISTQRSLRRSVCSVFELLRH